LIVLARKVVAVNKQKGKKKKEEDSGFEAGQRGGSREGKRRSNNLASRRRDVSEPEPLFSNISTG
jgi:hypothetical protein